MLRSTGLFKKLIILTQVMALVLAPMAAQASGNTPPSDTPNQNQQTFLTTQPIETSAGAAHLEVQTFEIRNAADLARAKAEILQKTKADTRATDVFRIEVKSTEHQTSSLDTATRSAVNEIESSLTAANKLDARPITVNPPNKAGFFKRHYNLTLSFVRFVANSVVVSTGLVMGAGVPVEHAIMIGALAGTMSGAIQLKSEALMKWLSNSVLLVNAAKRAGLIANTEGANPTRAEHVLKEIEMYGRWATLEAGFLIVVQTSMALLNIPVTENLFLTVGKSTASQGVYEVGVLKLANQLEKINPRWAARTSAFKNISLFAGSGVSVLAAIGSMIDMPFANLGFITLTTTGLLFTFGPKVMKSKPVEAILAGWRRLTTAPEAARQVSPRLVPATAGRMSAGSCRALFTL